MNNHRRSASPIGQDRSKPHRVRLPGFVTDQDVGLGDVIKRATSVVGIQPCGGCTKRANSLNTWVIFSKRR